MEVGPLLVGCRVEEWWVGVTECVVFLEGGFDAG